MPQSKPVVVVTRKLPDAIETRMMELFDARLNLSDAPMSKAQLIEAIAEADVLTPTVTDRIDAEVIRAAGANLKLIANFGTGVDHIDLAAAKAKGMVVTNTPDVLTEEVADTALGLLIMAVRELGAAERYLRAGRWAGEGDYPLTGGTLRGKTVGVLGLGRIGKAIAQRLEAFGLSIVYHGRSRQDGVDYAYYPDLAEMAGAVDILMSVAPGGAETRHIINADVLKALGPEGWVINIGRGSVVDEAALADALRTGTIAGAGLDVFENEPNVPAELMAFDNVVLLPHVGSASLHTRQLMGQLVVDNLRRWFDTKEALTPVAECRP